MAARQRRSCKEGGRGCGTVSRKEAPPPLPEGWELNGRIQPYQVPTPSLLYLLG